MIPGVNLPEDLIDFFELKTKNSAPTQEPPNVSLETISEEVCLLFQIERDVLTSAHPQKSRWVMAERLFVTTAVRSAGHRQSDIALALNRHKSQISRLLHRGEDNLRRDRSL